ncbi:MAG: hypothetical protein RLZZ118_126 [Bacteroidota bacterium]|jgi:hypothetical protein
MKKIIFSVLAFVAIASIQSCKRGGSSTPNPTPGNVKIYFNNLANGNAINMNAATPACTNDLAQKFSVSVLKYYISQIRLTDDKGVVTNLGNFSLINEDPTAPKKEVLFANVPAGNYTNVTFDFGLDKKTNALQNGTGDLDHSYDMWWSAEKYLFLKYEGNFINSANETKGMLFHVGTDAAYTPNISLPISGLTVNGNTKTIVVNFNFEKVFNGIDFNVTNNMMSQVGKDEEIVAAIAINVKSAFAFNKIQ